MRKAKLFSFQTKERIEYPKPTKVMEVINHKTGKSYRLGDIIVIEGCGYKDKRYKILEFFQLPATKGWMMRGVHLGSSNGKHKCNRGVIGYPEDVEVVEC